MLAASLPGSTAVMCATPTGSVIAVSAGSGGPADSSGFIHAPLFARRLRGALTACTSGMPAAGDCAAACTRSALLAMRLDRFRRVGEAGGVLGSFVTVDAFVTGKPSSPIAVVLRLCACLQVADKGASQWATFATLVLRVRGLTRMLTNK